ncbi:RNA12 protein [Blastomyces gilchristii SLH14081]|uniref:Mitochondrial escape protein 2 n=1 Tax=Blastomyces gilchristii (strain SLH14081) TaxID=559298 RepID=A0A179USL4_BLAGS|nr:RNA12 protein [Blastomyces gilchristii SLH14081]OAT11105.1 RNA12 protein [Blastomyces gilchristii SLH14081]
MIGILGKACLRTRRRPPTGIAWNLSRPALCTYKQLRTNLNHATIQSRGDESGHIQAGSNEAIAYVDNLFPLRLKWLREIPFTTPATGAVSAELKKRIDRPDFAASEPLSVVQRALPPELRGEITEIIPRYDEGGAFVKFALDSGVDATELEHQLKDHLAKNPIRPWFNPFYTTHAALVRGRPWIEDLYRIPSKMLKVEFLPTFPEASAAELTQETLYSLARRYGKLTDIVAQPSDSKVVPRYALIEYNRLRSAVAAKNCLHGFKVSEAEGGGKSETLLKITYEQKTKRGWIRDWLFNHPRIVIPVLAALLATITVIIFDPIRTFSIKIRIKPPLHLEDNIVWQWVQRQASKANQMIPFGRHDSETGGLKAVWEDRKNDIQLIKSWLLEVTSTLIIIQGPPGSGKKELVLDEVLADRDHKLVIDCKPIQDANGDTATINAAAAAVGYRPVFSWMNSVSSVIDVAIQGTTGAKAGFSETLDGQLGKILQNTANALKQVALEERKKDNKHANLSDEEYLEAHPESRPVVVIDNFLHKAHENPMIYEKLAQWAAALTTSNVARVIFLTTDVSASKSLSRALPNTVFHQISLQDCSPEVAKRFVLEHIRAAGEGKQQNGTTEKLEHMEGLDASIHALGGRLTDLEFLARMIKTGSTPKDAVQRIITESSAEILKMFILDLPTTEKPHWSPEQAWYLISKLGKSDSETLRYNEILLHPLFKSDGEAAIQALQQAELISVANISGSSSTIKPGKPVYRAAFEQLTNNKALSSRFGMAILGRLIAMENQNIQNLEKELQVLGSFPKQPGEIAPRVRWLLGKLSSSQVNVEKYEREASLLKRILEVE